MTIQEVGQKEEVILSQMIEELPGKILLAEGSHHLFTFICRIILCNADSIPSLTNLDSFHMILDMAVISTIQILVM